LWSFGPLVRLATEISVDQLSDFERAAFSHSLANGNTRWLGVFSDQFFDFSTLGQYIVECASCVHLLLEKILFVSC
jgi:hypothetical protein